MVDWYSWFSKLHWWMTPFLHITLFHLTYIYITLYPLSPFFPPFLSPSVPPHSPFPIESRDGESTSARSPTTPHRRCKPSRSRTKESSSSSSRSRLCLSHSDKAGCCTRNNWGSEHNCSPVHTDDVIHLWFAIHSNTVDKKGGGEGGGLSHSEFNKKATKKGSNS